MIQAEIITVMRNAIFTTIVVSGPIMIVALVIGIIVSIFQATTQINEQTLAFVPKIVGILLALLFFGSFMLTTLTNFTTELFESINKIIMIK